jgi:hypothetical protein
VPSPTSFSEALKLRDNSRINEWRAKMRLWSEKLKSGAIDFAEIKQAIDDANGHIQGAQFPKRLLPAWTSVATYPFAIYHTFAGHNEIAHLFGIALLGYELFHLYGAGISAAVKSSDPLKYKWLLVSNAESH